MYQHSHLKHKDAVMGKTDMKISKASRKFLDLSGYYMKFIKAYARIAEPLTKCLPWRGEQSYNSLKRFTKINKCSLYHENISFKSQMMTINPRGMTVLKLDRWSSNYLRNVIIYNTVDNLLKYNKRHTRCGPLNYNFVWSVNTGDYHSPIVLPDDIHYYIYGMIDGNCEIKQSITRFISFTIRTRK